MSYREPTVAEAEWQLVAAAERHAEVVAAIRLGARSPSSRQTATRALARGVQLVSFALGRAAAAGVPLERLVELTGWEEPLVRDALEHGPEAPVVARIAPEGLDPRAVAQAASSFEATARLDALLASIMADVGDPAWSPAAVDVDELCEGLENAWRAWRQGLGRRID